MSSSSPFSLSSLASHPIFDTRDADDQEDWEVVSPSSDAPVGSKKRRIAIRDKELYVAVGREVRVAHLGSVDEEYKVLTAPHLNFEIHSIIINSTGRLLAAIGTSQVTVVVLPKDDVASNKEQLECKSFAIDPYSFSPSSPHAIVDAHFHPFGESGRSLWILSSDGKLREYDVLAPADPAQTFHFLPPQSSSSRFSAADPLERYATSFAFGPSALGWGEMMVFVLIANGDIYSMGPILPLRTEVSRRWIQGLKGYVDATAELSGGTVSGEQSGSGTSREREWVDALCRHVKPQREVGQQASPARGSILSGRPRTTPTKAATPVEEGTVKLHPPQITSSGSGGRHLGLARQGPWILSPAPNEGDEEDIAVDLAMLSARADGEKTSEGGETVLAVAWSSGRVDLGVPVDVLSPRWDVPGAHTPPPTLAILESLQLDLTNDEEMMADNVPYFSSDPLHSDTIYIAHLSGVDSINVAPWISALGTDEPTLPPSDVLRLISTSYVPLPDALPELSSRSSDGAVEGQYAFWNAALGYALLGLSASGKANPVELSYRIGDLSIAISAPPPTASHADDKPGRESLLSGSNINFDDILKSLRTSNTSAPAALAKLPSARKPVDQISSDHLRAVGGVVAAIEARIQAIRKASQLIENRLALQLAELQRQIKVYNDCQAKIRTWKDDSPERAEQLMEAQEALSQRLDHVLSKMGGVQRPPVGEAEKKWFEELEKVRVKINGGGSSFGLGRTRGLHKRVKLVGEQLGALREKMGSRNDEADLGSLESVLDTRGEELRKLMKRMEELAMRIEKAESRDGSPA